MYTGLIEELGSFVGMHGPRHRFACRTVLEDATVDDSIAVNGCCLTVVAIGDGWWEADLSSETLQRTALGSLRPDDPVNLERSMRYADRLGGHLVQGHVDAIGEILRPGPHLRVQVRPDAGLGRYIVEKGSITVDGVSLTCFDVTDEHDGACTFSVALIPHTMAMTTLGAVEAGTLVNIEADMIARHVERLLDAVPVPALSGSAARRHDPAAACAAQIEADRA